MGIRRQAGVRDAKARLSEIVRDVKLGREWIITERGKPVARLVPIIAPAATLAERLKRLEDAGVIERPIGARRPLPPPFPLAFGLAQRILAEDRDA